MKKSFISCVVSLLSPIVAFAVDMPRADYAPPSHSNKAPPLLKKKTAFKKGKIDQHVKIAAVVNDQIITTQDLDERFRMLVRTDMKNIPPEQLPKIRQDILRQMIDEKLQLEITSNAKISITDEDVENAIKYMEEQNHMEPGSIMKELKEKGISKKTTHDHFGAKIAWSRLISYYRDTIEVGKKELNDKMHSEDGSEKRYLLAELVFHFDSPMEEGSAHEQASQALSRVRQGEHFSQVAYEMSHSPSAASGGDIGWIKDSQCEPSLKNTIKALKPGELSTPLKVGDAYKIVLLRNVREASNKADTLVARQLEVKLDPKLDEGQREEELKRLDGLFETLEGCQQFDKAEEQLDGNMHIYKDVSLPDLSEDLQQALKDLAVGKSSKGYMNDESIVYFMVCKRSLEKVQPVNQAEKTDAIVNQRLGSFAEQKLRDLRRVAAIDIRI